MELKKCNVLVTGGAGFIGSHLCEKLLSEGVSRVVSLDNYFTGSEQNHISGVEYIRGSTEAIASLITESFDLVFHLGEYSRVEQSFEDVDLVWKFNRVGTLAVIEFCRNVGAKLIYAGSSTKFGDGGLGREQSPYAWSKASNTELVISYGRWFGLDYAITYFYNVYGGREISRGKYATLIGIFTDRFKNNLPLQVVMPGHQKRNFTHIDDVVAALILIGKEAHGDEFGVGNDDAFSVAEVADMFGGNVEYLPERRGNRLAADVMTEKTKLLGWRAERHLHDYISSIKKTLD